MTVVSNTKKGISNSRYESNGKKRRTKKIGNKQLFSR